MAFGIGNVGAGGGGSLDVDFGTGRDGELFIDVNNTITLPVTAETGFIDKHYTTGYIDVNGILQPQARHKYTILRFAGDLTIRGTIDWTGSGAMHDSRFVEAPYFYTLGEYDAENRPKKAISPLDLYGNNPIFGGNGGAGGAGRALGWPNQYGGIGSAGNLGNILGGGAGGNGGEGSHTYADVVSSGRNAVASSQDYSVSTAYGTAGGGATGPGASGSIHSAFPGRNGTAFPGGLLVVIVAGNVLITASGKILNGGKPGANGNPSATVTYNYGASGDGGGGGGGVIMLLHGGNLSNAGTISVSGGAAGVGGNGGNAGGIGSILIKKVA